MMGGVARPRFWSSALFSDDGGLWVAGFGPASIEERFTVSANGRDIEVIVTQIGFGMAGEQSSWQAIDVDSYARDNRMDELPMTGPPSEPSPT